MKKNSFPDLQVSSRQISFKNYEDGRVYNEQLTITNKDTNDLFVSVEFENLEELKLSVHNTPSKVLLKPGDEVSLKLEFIPNQSYRTTKIDRRYEIYVNILNFNANLPIPIVILGACPSVNIPREIQLPDTAINMPSYSNIVILNYSKLPCKFSISTKRDIKLIPECKAITIKPLDGSSFAIEVIPKSFDEFREKISICFDNGTKTSILLKCKVLPVNVCLDWESVVLPPTYIGRKSTKSIHILNNGDNDTKFEWIDVESQSTDENNDPSTSFKFLQVNPLRGSLLPHSITRIDLIFMPEDTTDDDDDVEILKEIFITLGLKLSICQHYNPSIIVKGSVLGPSFQIDPKIVNINELYVGLTKYLDVNLINVGIIPGRFTYEKVQSINNGILEVWPIKGVINPEQTVRIKLKFLGRKIGKFIDQGMFRVKNGDNVKFAIQGLIMPLNITSVPQSLEFSASTICVPQKRLFNVKNEMPFDVDIAIEVDNNGTDDPLEFTEFYSNNSIIKTQSESTKSYDTTEDSSASFLTRTSIKQSIGRNGDTDACTCIGSDLVEIFNKVDEYLNCKEIVSGIESVLFDEIEKKDMADAVVELLLGNIYDGLKFDEKDWNIPVNPRQIECNKKFLKLKPNTEQMLKVFAIPNCFGKFSRDLLMYVSNINELKEIENPVEMTIVRVPVTVDCQLPALKIHNEIISISGYPECKIEAVVKIENLSAIDGFFTVPKYDFSQMEVISTPEKFHMPSRSIKSLNLSITPLVSGDIENEVTMYALGSSKRFTITIKCKSLPPDVVVDTKKIILHDLEVLKKHDTRIFIENQSTAKARFFVKMEHECECFSINPRGGILSGKQCIMIMLEKFFFDPGDYCNALVIEVVNGQSFRIPIKCSVKKLPILITPPVTNVIDFGTIFTTRNSPYIDYTLTNGGKKSYMIFIIQKYKKNRKEIPYKIEPNRFELAPNCSQVVRFSVNAENAFNYENEFSIDGCSIHSPIRELIWESTIKSNVVTPMVHFSSKNLIFNCYYGQGDDIMETLCITNNSVLALPITLVVEGDFHISNTEENLRFTIKPKDHVEVPIYLSQDMSDVHKAVNIVHGAIKVYTLGKVNLIRLTANIIYPEVDISTHEINMTSNKCPSMGFIILSNPSHVLPVCYELKFLDENTVVTPFQEYSEKNVSDSHQLFFANSNDMSSCEDINSHESSIKSLSRDNDENVESSTTKCSTKTDMTDDKKFTWIEKIQWNEVTKCISLPPTKKEFPSKHKIPENTECLNPTSRDDESQLSLSELKGTLKPRESRKVLIRFRGSIKAFHLSSILHCRVLGGRCHNIRINLTNCNPTVLISKTYFNITNSWHIITANNLRIRNMNPIQNSIKIITENNRNELIEGCVKLLIKNQSEFMLDEDENVEKEVKFSVYPGCLPTFKEICYIQVSDNPWIPITFECQNKMPMVTLLDIDRPALLDMNKTFEFETLREMFKLFENIEVTEEVITEDDIERVKLEIKEQEREQTVKRKINKTKSTKIRPQQIDNLSMGDNNDIQPKVFSLQYRNNGRAVWCEKPIRMCSGKMLQMVDEELDNCEFLALDYPNEYPQSNDIISFIAQYGFVKSLEAVDVVGEYRTIYEQHVLERFEHTKKCRGRGICREGFCDMSIVMPLPLLLPEYLVNFGAVQIDEIYEKDVRVYLHDDLTLLAIRSEVAIPGFSVEFSRDFSGSFKLVKYELEGATGKYFNRIERAVVEDEQVNPIRRCHSFDFVEGKVHSRTISKTKKDLDIVNQFYNEKMSTKVNLGEKCPFTLAEAFQIEKLSEEKIINFKISFLPSLKNYEFDSNFDEMLFLDVHLGPQIPIHIVARLVETKSDESIKPLI